MCSALEEFAIRRYVTRKVAGAWRFQKSGFQSDGGSLNNLERPSVYFKYLLMKERKQKCIALSSTIKREKAEEPSSQIRRELIHGCSLAFRLFINTFKAPITHVSFLSKDMCP